ncbi:LysR family transcriptional regulator, partial [Pandoraea pneumonica]
MTGEHFDVGLALRLMNEDVADGTATNDDLGGASATLVRRERLVWAMAATQTAPVDTPLPLVTLP